MRNTMPKILLLIALIIASLQAAHASLILDWNFTETKITTSPTEVILLNAFVSNDNSSTKNFDESLIMGAGVDGVGIIDFYSFSFGGDFRSQFENVILEPGESFEFVYGILRPRSSVPIGNYLFGPAEFNIPGFDGVRDKTVSISVVPIPAAVWLLGSALLGLFGIKRFKLDLE